MPQILSTTGVEIELRAWRGTGNTYRATFRTAMGVALNLVDYDVIFTVTDRIGGTVQHTETHVPPHENDAAGQALVNFPASATAGLTANRPYTWKYQILTRHRVTGESHIHFWGDLRVLTPPSPV